MLRISSVALEGWARTKAFKASTEPTTADRAIKIVAAGMDPGRANLPIARPDQKSRQKSAGPMEIQNGLCENWRRADHQF
jgi:hypothetical protein